MRLSQEFFNRNTIQVAQDLLGKFLVRKIGRKTTAVMITETEAYHGPNDLASHASCGLTNRTKIMFGPPGYIYVYMIYGMYCCLNFVTKEEGFPAAVLVRGVEGANGPGKLCRELKIDRTLNGLAPDNNKLWIEDREVKLKRSEIKKSKRIGVDYAGLWKEKLWRFTFVKY
jgi:DNA-3-methyladenine glycosylase